MTLPPSPAGISRRTLLTALATAGLTTAGLPFLTGCGSATRHTEPVTTPPHSTDGADPVRHAYGTDPAQYGELYLPTGQRKPGTVVILHGGFWRSMYGAELGAPLAADLVRRGYVVWNLEYRRVGAGGGWPNTLADVAAGIDSLAALKAGNDLARIDLTSVVAIGHSAGGHLATWAAGRPKLPGSAPGARPVVALTAVVAQAGVLDLERAAREEVGGTAVPDLLGGSFHQFPERYAEASPQAQLPIRVPVRCVHSPDDQNVPFDQSVEYVKAAEAAGDDAQLLKVPGDHFALIDTGSEAWAAVVSLLPDLMQARAAATKPR